MVLVDFRSVFNADVAEGDPDPAALSVAAIAAAAAISREVSGASIAALHAEATGIGTGDIVVHLGTGIDGDVARADPDATATSIASASGVAAISAGRANAATSAV